jgi:hypothetical protein
MVVLPVAIAVTKPLVLMVAALGFVDVQVAEVVKSCVVVSLYVPVAVNCRLTLTPIELFAGVTAMEISVGGVTVSVVEPLTDPEVA